MSRKSVNESGKFLILNFRRVLIVVSFLLGKSPASVYYFMPTFRNSLSVPSSKAMVESGKVVSPTHRPPLPPGDNLIPISVRG